MKFVFLTVPICRQPLQSLGSRLAIKRHPPDYRLLRSLLRLKPFLVLFFFMKKDVNAILSLNYILVLHNIWFVNFYMKLLFPTCFLWNGYFLNFDNPAFFKTYFAGLESFQFVLYSNHRFRLRSKLSIRTRRSTCNRR